MNIGIPLEVMTGEARVALIPDACERLINSGHSVYLQMHAGEKSGYSDDDYAQAGVIVVATADELYSSAQLIVKVKQPLEADLLRLNDSHIVFGYFHLAADHELIHRLSETGLTVIPFESVNHNGQLNLLAPMSRVAGRIAVIRGASLLFRNRGGRGVLLGGVEGADAGNVVVLGAGVAGTQAVATSVALGAHVDVVDLDVGKLQTLKTRYPDINTHCSTPEIISRLCIHADLVIGAVLLAGRRAPVILKQSVVQQMNEGSVIVDIAIDQGGCVEGIRMTDSEVLSYLDHGVCLSAVPNMPATVARTSTQALSSAVLPYVEVLAEAEGYLSESVKGLLAELNHAVALKGGVVVDPVLMQEINE